MLKNHAGYYDWNPPPSVRNQVIVDFRDELAAIAEAQRPAIAVEARALGTGGPRDVGDVVGYASDGSGPGERGKPTGRALLTKQARALCLGTVAPGYDPRLTVRGPVLVGGNAPDLAHHFNGDNAAEHRAVLIVVHKGVWHVLDVRGYSLDSWLTEGTTSSSPSPRTAA